MFKRGGFRRTVGWLQGNGMGFLAPIKSDQRCEFRRVVWFHDVGFWRGQLQAAGRIVRGMRCRHLSMHGCNFESDRRRIVGSSSSFARGTLGSYGDRTQGNSNRSGGEVVRRLLLGLEVEASAPAGEQLRRYNI